MHLFQEWILYAMKHLNCNIYLYYLIFLTYLSVYINYIKMELFKGMESTEKLKYKSFTLFSRNGNGREKIKQK